MSNHKPAESKSVFTNPFLGCDEMKRTREQVCDVFNRIPNLILSGSCVELAQTSCLTKLAKDVEDPLLYSIYMEVMRHLSSYLSRLKEQRNRISLTLVPIS